MEFEDKEKFLGQDWNAVSEGVMKKEVDCFKWVKFDGCGHIIAMDNEKALLEVLDVFLKECLME